MSTTTLANPELSLQHLEAELRRIEARVRREVQRCQRAGQDPADDFRGLYLSDAHVKALLQRPWGTGWGRAAELLPEEAQAFASAENRATLQAAMLAQEARECGQQTHLEHLAATFGLDRFELDTLLICLAPALDLRYERLYGYLQDDVTRKQPSVSLVLDLLCEPGSQRLAQIAHFDDQAALFRHHLLERLAPLGTEKAPLLGQALQPDPAIVAWLLGSYRPHAELGPYARVTPPQADAEDRLLAAQVWPELEPIAGQATPHGDPAVPLLVFYGPDEAAQESAARLVAAQAGCPLLQVDFGAAVAAGRFAQTVLALALRDARLIGAIPYLVGWDACMQDRESTPPPELLSALCAYPGLALVGGQANWHAQGIARERSLLWVEFPIPTYAQRLALWKCFLDHNLDTGTEAKSSLALSALAGQFVLTAEQIRDAVGTARDLANRRGTAIRDEDLFVAARIHSNPHLSGLARKITPRYTWPDIILPDDQIGVLREIVATVRERPKVLEEWGVGRKLTASDGITVLFAGPPGTGKTMAAEVIADELGLDLYKIDLSTVVSKYIGETEKNMERIFAEAQSSNAILFFDEADALFGKRSEVKDAHDRYANIEISYLLQRMESYDGITILATNLRANLDEAFTRRLQFAINFPFPEEDDRLRIWQTLFPPDVPRAPGLDLGLLARRFKLAGGSIRNVIVSAAFLAASDDSVVTMAHLLHGTRRELQKMGRLVREVDMEVNG